MEGKSFSRRAFFYVYLGVGRLRLNITNLHDLEFENLLSSPSYSKLAVEWE